MVYLRKLRRRIIEFFNERRWRKQRGIKGYSDFDLWDIDFYLGDLIPRMIAEFADKTQGYPSEFHDKYGEKGFDEWIKYLYEMSYWFNEANIDNIDDENIWSDMFFEKCEEEKHFKEASITPGADFVKEKDELFKRYCIESKRLDYYKKMCLEKGFKMLCEHFHDLWW